MKRVLEFVAVVIVMSALMTSVTLMAVWMVIETNRAMVVLWPQ